MNAPGIVEIINVLQPGSNDASSQTAIKNQLPTLCGKHLGIEKLQSSRRGLNKCFCCPATLSSRAVSHPLWPDNRFCENCAMQPRCVVCERRVGERTYFLDEEKRLGGFNRYQIGRYKGRNPLYVCPQCTASGTVQNESARHAEDSIQTVIERIKSDPLLQMDFDTVKPSLEFHQEQYKQSRTKRPYAESVLVDLVDIHQLSRPQKKTQTSSLFTFRHNPSSAEWGEDLVFGRCECLEHGDNCSPRSNDGDIVNRKNNRDKSNNEMTPRKHPAVHKDRSLPRSYGGNANSIVGGYKSASAPVSPRHKPSVPNGQTRVEFQKNRNGASSFESALKPNYGTGLTSARSPTRSNPSPHGHPSVIPSRRDQPTVSDYRSMPSNQIEACSPRTRTPNTNMKHEVKTRAVTSAVVQRLGAEHRTIGNVFDSSQQQYRPTSSSTAVRADTRAQREAAQGCADHSAPVTDRRRGISPAYDKLNNQITSSKNRATADTIPHIHRFPYNYPSPSTSPSSIPPPLSTQLDSERASFPHHAHFNQTRGTISAPDFLRFFNARCPHPLDHSLRRRQAPPIARRTEAAYGSATMVQQSNRGMVFPATSPTLPSSAGSLVTTRTKRVGRVGRALRGLTIADGLPSAVFESTLSHELTHAYIFATGYRFPLVTEEGICNAVCMLYVFNQLKIYSQLIQELSDCITAGRSHSQTHKLLREYFPIEAKQCSTSSGYPIRSHTVLQSSTARMHMFDPFSLNTLQQNILIRERLILRHRLCVFRFRRMMFGDTPEYLAATLILPLLLTRGLHYCLELFHRHHAKLRSISKRKGRLPRAQRTTPRISSSHLRPSSTEGRPGKSVPPRRSVKHLANHSRGLSRPTRFAQEHIR